MIRRSPQSILSAAEMADYIAADDLNAALRFLDHLEESLAFLHEWPRAGREFRPATRSRRLRGLRTWPVNGFPNHIIFYRPTDDGIEVVDLIHSSRDIDSALGG